jgi:hypothetical protein
MQSLARRTSRETETTPTEDESSETSTRNIRGHRFRLWVIDRERRDLLAFFAAYENRRTNGSNNADSPSITAEEERSAESPERHETSETGRSEPALATGEARALDEGRHGYSLRPRAKRNYKE